MRLIVKNAALFDTARMEYSGEGDIVVEDGVIVQSGGRAGGAADATVEARGAFALPGFVDAHAHFRLTTMDYRKLAQISEVEFGIVMARLAEETLQRGFTTVRDPGGDVSGLIRAIAAGDAQGPRIFRAGLMLSQTGGHGDVDGTPRAVPDCACQIRHDSFSIIADGVDAVRKAARHNLRAGSDFLKVHVSGGVYSPSDPIDSVQFTPSEIGAATEEARNRRTYVAAHAYTPPSIRLAVENGVHTIEHGNLIDRETAELMAAKGAVLVPTLVTYHAMEDLGEKLGLPLESRRKNRTVLEAGLGSLEIARRAGVVMGFGTDLIGEAQVLQNREFAIRAEVLSPREILTALYVVNPRLCRLDGKVGTLAEGAFGDVVLVRKNPLDDIRVLADWENTISHVIKAGRVVRAP